MPDTIFALSSGSPPAAISVVRISGPAAGVALERLAGNLPEPRKATYRSLRGNDCELLDRAFVLWLPGPATSTGEDTAELHLHGGRAIVAAVESALASMPELRRATSGEFTRRAFVHGRIDLAEAEGLADLLAAETELQRRSAQAMAGGGFSRLVEDWRERLLSASAAVEAVLDFGDEDDVAVLPADFAEDLEKLQSAIAEHLGRPRAEVLRDGLKVVLAGPPNAGKSTLFNALVGSEAAITAPVAGTTRDVLTKAVAMAGMPFVFHDTAGLRDRPDDTIEIIGVERARSAVAGADLVLWLGPEGEGPERAWEILPQSDRLDRPVKHAFRHKVSAVTGEGLDDLRRDLIEEARRVMPRPGVAALNERQHRLLGEAEQYISTAVTQTDPLLVAEHLRLARVSFDALLGRTTTENMLDALFGRFCIGK